jgi:capsid portal protein
MSNLESVANLQIKTQFEVKVNVDGNRLQVDLTSVRRGSVIKVEKRKRGYVQQVKQGKVKFNWSSRKGLCLASGQFVKKRRRGGIKTQNQESSANVRRPEVWFRPAHGIAATQVDRHCL